MENRAIELQMTASSAPPTVSSEVEKSIRPTGQWEWSARKSDIQQANQTRVPRPAASVTHVLCCPKCSFVSLQESLLIQHTAALHSVSGITVFRCRICQAASTRWEIMMEHCAIYHGMLCQKEIIAHLASEMLKAPPTESIVEAFQQQQQQQSAKPQTITNATPTGSRKRKAAVPERLANTDSNDDKEQSCITRLQVLDNELCSKRKTTGSVPNCDKLQQSKQQQQQLLPTVDMMNAAKAAAALAAPFAIWDNSNMGSMLIAAAAANSRFQDACDSTDVALDLSLRNGCSSESKDSNTVINDSSKYNNNKKINSGSCSDSGISEEKRQKSSSAIRAEAKLQRQNFSSSQNNILMQWFIQHERRPYPSTEDTRHLTQLTGLTYAQVKKWFANKRMRSKTSVGVQHSPSDGHHHFEWELTENGNNNYSRSSCSSSPVANNDDTDAKAEDLCVNVDS